MTIPRKWKDEVTRKGEYLKYGTLLFIFKKEVIHSE